MIKKRPSGLSLRGFLVFVTCAGVPIETRVLLSGPSGNHLAGVHDLQRLGIVSALEIERLVVGAVDMNHLASVQADANASRRTTTLIGPVPHYDVEAATAGTRS